MYEQAIDLAMILKLSDNSNPMAAPRALYEASLTKNPHCGCSNKSDGKYVTLFGQGAGLANVLI
jgi:hypothetical protein